MKKTADGRGLARVSRTTVAIINGDDDLSTWSEEELERGARRGSDGRFRKKPSLVAKAVHDELVRRKHTKAYELLRDSTHDAVRVLVEILNDEEADRTIRVRSAELILDRVLGKAPQHVSIDLESPGLQAHDCGRDRLDRSATEGTVR